MRKIYDNLTQLIGNTPMLSLRKYCRECNIEAEIIAKLESFNPLSSVKDRVALSMIEDAERAGKISKGSVIIEPTSGNTGIGLAFIGASKGYEVILTMPETMSIERRNLLKMLGAKVVLTEGAKGMNGAIEKASELVHQTPGAFMPQQFKNCANPKAHYLTTAEEILNDTNNQIDIFVSAVGTGGTLTGVGSRLKEVLSDVKIVAVEPYSSSVLSGEKPGPHKIQGIGAGFIPDVCNTELIDEIMRVRDEEAFEACKRIAKSEGLLVGISSGAALYAAEQLGRRAENKNKNIVVVFPDNGEKYLSTDLYK